jgi:phenylacetate-CoA ligase
LSEFALDLLDGYVPSNTMNRLLNRYLVYYPSVSLRGQFVAFHSAHLRRSQWLDSSQIENLQLRKLAALLDFARQNVPYYGRILQDVDFTSNKSLAILERIPTLTKELLKENFEELRCKRLRSAIKKTTGGSTGNPVTIFKSRNALALTYAAYWRGYEWAGVQVGDRQGRFWGIPHESDGRRYASWADFLLNRFRCSAFAFSDHELALYYEQLNRFKPNYFYGYVSMLEAFARFLLRNRLELKFKLACTIATSEVLTEPHRRLFESAFGCRVFNEYGCGEMGTIAHECEHGAMHIAAERIIVEVLKDGRSAQPGETGEIVVTELHNKAMPLIRYNLKDLGIVSDLPCRCGRGLPVLKEIKGRAYDTIYNKEGQAFHGQYFMYIFEELQRQGINISAFQVTQLDWENIVVRLVATQNERQRAEHYIERKVHGTYGHYAKIRFEYVQQIDRERSGKIRLIKSMAPRPKESAESDTRIQSGIQGVFRR